MRTEENVIEKANTEAAIGKDSQKILPLSQKPK